MGSWKERYLEIIGRLQRERKLQSYTQEEMAARLVVSRRTFQRWENGEQFPDAAELFRWANILEIEICAKSDAFKTTSSMESRQ